MAGGHVVADKRVNYVYNALSQVTYINRFHNLTGGNGAALRTYLTYDSADRVDTIQHRNVDDETTSNLLNQYTFGYDNVSRTATKGQAIHLIGSPQREQGKEGYVPR